MLKLTDTVEIGKILEGEIISLETVPDQLYSQKMLGNGIAIIPTGNIVKSPCTATIATISEVGHSLVLNADGKKILIHIGLDSFLDKGAFTVFVKEGQQVKEGDALIKIDLAKLSQKYIPIILLDEAE